MRRALIASALWGGLAASLSGCALLLVGAGAAGGYAISRDAIQNEFTFPNYHIYRVSMDTAHAMGTVTFESEAQGVIKAAIEDAQVTITVRRLGERATQLKVRARNRFFFPKIEVAHEVYNRILKQL